MQQSELPRPTAGAVPAPVAGRPLRFDEIPQALLDERLAVVPGFLPDPVWRGLAREARALHRAGRFRHAGVGRGPSFRVEPATRNDQVLWIDTARPSRPQARWLARVEALRLLLNERLYLGAFGFESHLSLYPPGARYVTHLDRFADAPHRVVSLVLYLNDAWCTQDGGALRLYLEERERPPWCEVLPVGGTLVAFLAHELHHEVLPAARERLAAVGWLTRR